MGKKTGGVEGHEYMLDKKGKYTCLVCPNKPKCGNLKQFKIHRTSKVHRARYSEWKKLTKTKLLFTNFSAPDLLSKKRPNLDSRSMPAAKRQKLAATETKTKQRQLLSVIKALPKFHIKKIMNKIAQVAPAGIRRKPDGRPTLSIKSIVQAEDLDTLIMFCEGFRTQDVSKLTKDQRALRDWQFIATVQKPERKNTPPPTYNGQHSEEDTPSPCYHGAQPCWRRFVVPHNATLHDITKIVAKCLGWLAEDSGKAHGKFDWHRNTGKAVGMLSFPDDPQLQSQLRSKTSLQGHEVGQVFLVAGTKSIWKFGDHQVAVQFEGTSPGQDPLKRELPRCVGGCSPAPAYLNSIKNQWKSSWNDMELFRLNHELLSGRTFTDGFKTVQEWEKCRSTALRRAAPIISPQGVVLRPYSNEEFMHRPFSEMDTGITWKWGFQVIMPCNVLEERGKKDTLLSCLPTDTEILVDEFFETAKEGGWLRMYKPFKGWVRLRNEKGVRLLMPRMGRKTVLPKLTNY